MKRRFTASKDAIFSGEALQQETEKMILSTADLPQFIAESDRIGGPFSKACDEYWESVVYRPDFVVDQSLDPFSEDYVAQQLTLYREMCGLDFDQVKNEHTTLNVESHVLAVNPYNHQSPGGLAQHIERLARAIRLGAPPRDSTMLDMGSGWGLSSEIAAYCGVKVRAVDINPDFVDLVNRRAARLNNPITAEQSTFDDFESEERFSMILFYECFHHALRPWTLLSRMARHLTPDGRIVMAGEPINDIWWKHWGLRLDPLSVYCIHKLGWFESGWSAPFLEACFEKAGLTVKIVTHPEGEVGAIVVGARVAFGHHLACDIGRLWRHHGWIVEDIYMTSQGDSRLSIPWPEEANTMSITFHNFRQKPIPFAIRDDEKILVERDLPLGENLIEISRADVKGDLRFISEVWVPDIELGNGDIRELSIHLQELSFY